MAIRDKISSRGRVDDRRGQQMIGMGGGVSIVGVLLVLAVGYFGGPEQAIQVRQDMQQNTQTIQQTSTTGAYDGEDEYEIFASTVLGSLNSLWKGELQERNMSYQEPTLVLFRGGTQSACGGAISQVGPHYCPLDSTIYLDETFFEELRNTYGAQGGDLAQAYVIAHEGGHHVQKLLGTANKKGRGSDNNDSINIELQADCLAGIRIGAINKEGVLEKDDLYEALDAAQAVGDDSIQKKTTGTVQPESRTHGSSEQRKEWLMKGYTSQSIDMCNTFG